MRAAPRSTRDHLDLSTEDLIEPQDVVVTLSHAGYAKSQPVTEYQTQRRGGRDKAATAVKDEDFVEKLFVAHTPDTVLCFSNRGKAYWLKVYELPQAGRGARGKPHGQPVAARRGREDQRRAAGKAVRRAALRVHGDEPGHGERRRRSLRSRVRAPPASSRSTWPRTTSSSASASPTARRKSCSCRAVASPSASTRAKCGRWVARPRAFAASSSVRAMRGRRPHRHRRGQHPHGIRNRFTAS